MARITKDGCSEAAEKIANAATIKRDHGYGQIIRLLPAKCDTPYMRRLLFRAMDYGQVEALDKLAADEKVGSFVADWANTFQKVTN